MEPSDAEGLAKPDQLNTSKRDNAPLTFLYPLVVF
jgi:hypothetical protein